jgi:hypothetical protein
MGRNSKTQRSAPGMRLRSLEDIPADRRHHWPEAVHDSVELSVRGAYDSEPWSHIARPDWIRATRIGSALGITMPGRSFR